MDTNKLMLALDKAMPNWPIEFADMPHLRQYAYDTQTLDYTHAHDRLRLTVARSLLVIARASVAAIAKA